MDELVDLVSDFGNGGSVLSLIDGWAGHVLRLYRERLTPASAEPPGLWGIFDFVAALHIRAALDDCLQPLPGPAPAAVEATDELFRAMTTPDVDGLLRSQAATLGSEVFAAGWWWGRIPSSGEPRRDLDEFVRRPYVPHPLDEAP